MYAHCCRLSREFSKRGVIRRREASGNLPDPGTPPSCQASRPVRSFPPTEGACSLTIEVPCQGNGSGAVPLAFSFSQMARHRAPTLLAATTRTVVPALGFCHLTLGHLSPCHMLDRGLLSKGMRQFLASRSVPWSAGRSGEQSRRCRTSHPSSGSPRGKELWRLSARERWKRGLTQKARPQAWHHSGDRLASGDGRMSGSGGVMGVCEAEA